VRIKRRNRESTFERREMKEEGDGM